MLEKPDIADQLILSCVNHDYGLFATQLAFLPLGVDVNAAVYRLVAQDGEVYFLKLRKGSFEELIVAVPQFLNSQGIPHILAPVPTLKGQLWGSLEEYSTILYPFVAGKDGYEATLTDQQWVDLGAAIRAVHAAHISPHLKQKLPREVYSSRYRQSVREFQAQVVSTTYEDPISARLAAFIQDKQAEISRIVERGETLGQALQKRPLEFVLCHADLHAGNLLISGNEAFFIVDWDSAMLAPKECDLMFAGAGLSSNWPAERETELFYQGYGPAQVDAIALAYYRYERVIQDVASFCKEIFLSGDADRDRQQAYIYLTSQFLPGHLVETAFASDRF